MKRVFGEYGASVMAVLLAAAIGMVLLGSKVFYGGNFTQLLGQVLCFSIEEIGSYESDAFRDYMTETLPTFTKREGVVVRKDERVLLADIYEARTKDGRLLPVYVKNAWQLDGKEIELGLSADRSSICVRDAGVYWIHLYTVIEGQRECSVVTKLLVNER